jgi:hypothetical protein
LSEKHCFVMGLLEYRLNRLIQKYFHRADSSLYTLLINDRYY